MLAREWELVPGATYFEAFLTDDRTARVAYIHGAQQALAHCDVVFVDPDNGIEVPSTKFGAAGSSKYVFWRELQAIYAAGQSVLIYQHFPRVVRERFVPFLAQRLREELVGSTVTAYSTAYVAFFLVQQPKHASAFLTVAPDVRRQWRSQIEPWPAADAGRPNAAMEPTAPGAGT